MSLLVLGGTAFLGRAVATAARDRGIAVTCLARGTAPAPDGVAFVPADRDGDDGLAAVSARRWDAVVDLSRHPGHVRRAVRDLETDHWVLVSTANVYARFDSFEQDEAAQVVDPLDGDLLRDMAHYGQAKVACERAIATAPASATIVRPGLIGGPGDATGRSGYYPWRFAHPSGPDVLVPPDLDFPCALVDVDDLASWIVDAAERRIGGTFNAAGRTTTLGALLETARTVVGDGAPPPRPVPADVLAAEGVAAWMGPRSLPLWIDDPDARCFATLDTTAARRHGLRTRPLEETLARALAWEETRTQPRLAGLTDEEERALRAVL